MLHRALLVQIPRLTHLSPGICLFSFCQKLSAEVLYISYSTKMRIRGTMFACLQFLVGQCQYHSTKNQLLGRSSSFCDIRRRRRGRRVIRWNIGYAFTKADHNHLPLKIFVGSKNEQSVSESIIQQQKSSPVRCRSVRRLKQKVLTSGWQRGSVAYFMTLHGTLNCCKWRQHRCFSNSILTEFSGVCLSG